VWRRSCCIRAPEIRWHIPEHDRLRRRKPRGHVLQRFRRWRAHLRRQRSAVKKCIPNCTSPTSRTVYIFSGGKDVAEYDNGAAVTVPTKEFVYSGSQLLANFVSGATNYFHRDHLSNRLWTDGSTGNISGQRGHFPFGETWYESGNATKFKFTTYERDSESGNDYAVARYDISRFGRFSSPDSVAGTPIEPHSLNRYLYTANDPINKNDPSGSITLPCYPNCGGGDIGVAPGPCWFFPDMCSALTGHPSVQAPNDPFGGRIPGQEGAAALAKALGNNRQPPRPSDCWIFAESLADRLWNSYMRADPNNPGLIGQLGSQMMTEAQANTPAGGGRWKTQPIGGFKQELVSNNQRGDVYRHILFFAGSQLRGAFEWNYAARAYDWGQAFLGRAESETELRDDRAGIAVGTAMRQIARAGGSGDYQQLFRDIANTICD